MPHTVIYHWTEMFQPMRLHQFTEHQALLPKLGTSNTTSKCASVRGLYHGLQQQIIIWSVN